MACLCATSALSAISTLVPVDATWRFLDDGSNQGASWTAIGFADGGWSMGAAELGYGDGDEATTVGYGGNQNQNNKFVTTYFRHSFIITNSALYSGPTMKLVRDDGVAVYLNRQEVFRNNLPAGPINFSTLALADIEGVAEFTFLSTNLPAGLLINGTNVLAVEIHQVTRSSPDISFALELSAVLLTNNPPTVALTSPTNGANFFAPAEIPLAATANDPDGPVSWVEFFAGTNRLGEASSAPFNFTWAGVMPGSYGLRAVAIDPAGARGTSGVVNITVRANLRPTVSVLQPTNGSVFIVPTNISFAANASDPDGSISRVEFYEGDTLLGEDMAAPYAFTWTNVSAGHYQFSVVAVDNLEARSNPGIVDVTVIENTPPLVAITSPTNTSRFVAPTDVTVRVSASDNETRVERVDVYEGANVLGVLTNAPYTLTWTNVPVGIYALSAVATDDYGLSRTSAPISISVNENMPPLAVLQFPTNGASFIAPADILLRAAASDVDGFIRVVDFYEGTNKLGESRDSPFFLSWTDVAQGTYQVYAVATDNKGGRGTSSVATVSVLFPKVVRGPYLQNGNSNSVTIRWRTDVPTDTRVEYGVALDSLSTVVSNSTRATDHEIRLTGLLADTRYYYSAGFDGVSLVSGPDHFFVTAPLGDKPTRVWVLGDSGTANDHARAVRDAYYSFAGTNDTDLWLMLGDNAYCCGFDYEYQAAVFDMYPEMLRKSVLWPAIGNHDTYATFDPDYFPYLDIFTLPTGGEAGGVASGTEKYYSFDYSNIHFICLDSMTLDRSSNAPMCSWLREDLAANTKLWTIAYWHHPPYSKGSHDSDLDWEYELVEMRENVLPILESYGVDLVLAGHSHCYERSYLLSGHYGASDTLVPEMIKDAGDGRWAGSGAYVKRLDSPAGIQSALYVVAGSSGQATGGELNHPAMFISLNELGSLVLDVDGNRLDAKFLQDNGTVTDTFTVLKGIFTNTVEVLSFERGADSVRLMWKSNPGDSYVIEAASNVTTSGWQPVSPVMRANTDLTRWDGAVSANVLRNFYRVRVVAR